MSDCSMKSEPRNGTQERKPKRKRYYRLKGECWTLFCRTCYANWAGSNLPQEEDRAWWHRHEKLGLLKLAVGSGISSLAWKEAVEGVVAYNESCGIHELCRMRIPDAFLPAERHGGKWIGEAVWN